MEGSEDNEGGLGRDRRQLMREDLETLREELGLGLHYHERVQNMDDLRQVRRAVRLGISLRAWATAQGVPLAHAKALRR